MRVAFDTNVLAYAEGINGKDGRDEALARNPGLCPVAAFYSPAALSASDCRLATRSIAKRSIAVLKSR
jgi:hypothetical protein